MHIHAHTCTYMHTRMSNHAKPWCSTFLLKTFEQECCVWLWTVQHFRWFKTCFRFLKHLVHRGAIDWKHKSLEHLVLFLKREMKTTMFCLVSAVCPEVGQGVRDHWCAIQQREACKLRAVLGSQDSRATTFQHLNSSLHWGISRGRNWFCAMLLKAIKRLKKRKIHRHHYNRNQSPKSKLKAPIQGYDFPWSLAARCQQSMTSMWCGAEDPLRTPWVYRPCQLVPRATTFQPFFCFKPSLFCICLKGLGWFRHLLCKRCRKSLVKGWDIGGVLTCEKWRRWLGTSSTPMCSAYI